MTSTAIDAVVAIVVVSAAITTLAAIPADVGDGPDADPTLETLTTGTTAVNYTEGVGDDTGDTRARRTASGSYAELLGRAALTSIRVEGQPATDAGESFRAAVDNATRTALPPRTRVVVLWRPYPDSHLEARFAVGPTPPPNADLAGASTTVPNGFSAAKKPALEAADADGYAGVSRVFADRVVAGLFPPERTAVALRGPSPAAPLAAHRYQQFADAYGVDLGGSIAANRPAAANDRLADALASRIETDLRATFDSPRAAARAGQIDRVELVVRRWE